MIPVSMNDALTRIKTFVTPLLSAHLHPSGGMFSLIFWSFVAFTLAMLHLPWQLTIMNIFWISISPLQ